MRSKFKWIFTLLLLALSVQFSFAQERVVSGVVSDNAGLPLPGVSVLVKGTRIGTQSDFDGTYSIKASSGQVLIFSYIGMKTQEVKATSTVLNVKLGDDSVELEGVVVVGYGVQKRSEVTSSISNVKGEAIKGLITPNFMEQIAGRATGVQVTTSTGILGQAPKIRIRGTASISSGTDPLYVVDGMPIYSGDLGGYANASGLGDINPNDIESVEILKDGAASAIYGSRAANGVVLITTKKGKKGDVKVDFNTVVGFGSPIKTFDLLNTAQFLEIANEKRTNRALAPWAVGSTFDTDWQSEVLRKSAVQIDNSLSISGGTDKTKYYLSLGYLAQEGVSKANEMGRYSVRTNVEHQLNNWLTLGTSVGLSKTDYDGLNTGANSLSGNMFNAIRQVPNTPVYDANNPTGYNINMTTGNMGQWDNLSPLGDNITNLVYVLDHNKFKSNIQRALINAFAGVKFSKDLNYRFQVSVDNAQTSGFLYYNPVHGDGRGSNGRLQNSSTNLLRWNVQHILNYNKTIADSHNFGVTAVAEYQKEKNQSFFGVGTNLLDEFYNQNLVTGAYANQESGGGITEVGIISYVGRLTYNYKQKYFAQASLRRDGISKLAPEKRWNNFTGYSVGWNVAKESFMEGINEYVNEFKLRASYSETGNTEIGTYPYFNLTSGSPYGAQNGLAFTQFGNDQLMWETSKKMDFGIDAAFFNNKLKVGFDYFKNDIDGMILEVPVSPSLGVPSNKISKNIGKMFNEGYEFMADYQIINSDEWKWNVGANITFQKNEITSLPGGSDIVGGSSTDININPNIIIREGESSNSLYGFVYWGVNPANGSPVYYKADGTLVQAMVSNNTYKKFDPNNPADVSTAASLVNADKKILGNTLPTYFGGVKTNVAYKNFDLNVLVRFSGGNKIFNSTRRELMNQNFNNNSTEILGRWQSAANPGDGWTPILWASSNTFLNQSSNASTRFVENGDFISLDNISLGYTLPKSLLTKIKVDAIRLYVQAQNLLIITDYKGLNPEMETFGVDMNGTPRSQIISLGLNVKL